MEMCYDGVMVMPKNFKNVSQDEMIYVEGGGTFSVTLKKSTITWALCTIGVAITKWALNAILYSASVSVATAITLGSCGTGVMIAGLLLYYGSWLASFAAGAIVKNIAGRVYKGGNIKIAVASGKFIPTYNVSI